MPQENTPSYGQEEAAYGPRETALTAVFAFAPQRVFNAVEQAAERQGLTLLMASAANGLLVARPAFSLLNLGRRVAVTFSPTGQQATRVSARYTHGLVSFEDRYARLSLLSSLFRTALLQLEAGEVAREAAQRLAAPSEEAPPEAPANVEQPAPAEADAESSPPRAYPTLNELRARARAEEMARHGLPSGDPEAEAFLAEPPEGFRLPGLFKARRIFWFALGVVLAVVIMVLMSLSTR